MFLMTSDIQIGDYKVKPVAVKWKCSTSNIVDTCSIRLPRIVYLSNNLNGTDTEVAGKFQKLKYQPFEEGNPVWVKLGYNHDNKTVFKGFLRRISNTAEMELECEGYSYQLKNVILNKSYSRTTIRKILQDLTQDTDILISKYIPDVALKNVQFKNYSGIKVLEWFQKECFCSVFFDFDTLYAGAFKQGIPKPTQKIRLGWNTLDDSDFKKKTSASTVNVEIVEKTSDGNTKKTTSGSGSNKNGKEVKIKTGLPDAFVKSLVDELQKQENYGGYSGTITCFLQPVFEKGYTAEISDRRFPEREGLFFVETVEGSFDSGGGVQKITVNYYGNV